MKIKVTVRIQKLESKLSRAKAEIPRAAREELESLAAAAVKLTREGSNSDRASFFSRQIERQLDSVFIPVALKHERTERWPNLAPIYQSRIVRHSRTYDGRKLFWVDQNKREALAAQIMARAMEKGTRDTYEVRFVSTSNKRFRVEIVRRGRRGVPPYVIAFAQQHVKQAATNTIARALTHAGFMNSSTATHYSHRGY